MDKNIENKNLVSIIMPAFNSEKFISEAIKSVLSQTYQNFELIIVDDCSTDNTIQKIQRYKDKKIILLKNKKNMGVSVSRNKAISLAKGKFIALLDSDDIALPNRIEKQIDFLLKNKKFIAIGSWAEIINETTKKKYLLKTYSNPIILKWKMVLANQFINSSMCIRKRIFQKLNYNPLYISASDYDFWSKIIKYNKMTNIKDVLVKYRIHNFSLTQSKETRKKSINTTFKIIFGNCKYYTKINYEQFKILFDALLDKKNHRVKNLSNLITGIKIYSKLFYSYIKKEKLNHKNIKILLPYFAKDILLFLRWYIKTNLPFVYNLIKNINKVL